MHIFKYTTFYIFQSISLSSCRNCSFFICLYFIQKWSHCTHILIKVNYQVKLHFRTINFPKIICFYIKNSNFRPKNPANLVLDRNFIFFIVKNLKILKKYYHLFLNYLIFYLIPKHGQKLYI